MSRTKKKRDWNTMQGYSFGKVTEDGPGRRYILSILKDAGLDAIPHVSPYVGQTAVIVFGGKRAQHKARRLIYGTR